MRTNKLRNQNSIRVGDTQNRRGNKTNKGGEDKKNKRLATTKTTCFVCFLYLRLLQLLPAVCWSPTSSFVCVLPFLMSTTPLLFVVSSRFVCLHVAP
jgi:hypothetical protein